jgi:hypothetical protein
MGDVVSFPILDSDLGRELIVDLARFRENLLDEKTIRKKHRLADDVWEKLGDDDELIRKVEEESVRRIRDGSSKREKAQQLVVKAPDVLSNILNDAGQSARHRIDSAKVLNDFAANGPAAAAGQSDRFIISINLTGDSGTPHILNFSKSLVPNAGDTDPFNDVDDNTTPTPWGMFAIAKKQGDDGNGNAI